MWDDIYPVKNVGSGTITLKKSGKWDFRGQKMWEVGLLKACVTPHKYNCSLSRKHHILKLLHVYSHLNVRQSTLNPVRLGWVGC